METTSSFWTATHVWIAIATVFILLEVFTPVVFGFILAGAAALCAAAMAGLDLPLAVQLGVFAVVLILTMVLLRPRIVARLQSSAHIPSRTEAVIGKMGQVTEEINPITGGGRILVAGEDWAAFSESPIAAGSQVKVVGADGIRLQVTTL